MPRMFSIAKRIILQMLMDKRSLALLIVAPIAMLALLWVVINAGTQTPTLAVYGISETLQTELSKDATLTNAASVNEVYSLVKALKADAAVYCSNDSDQLIIALDGADPSISSLVIAKFQKASARLAEKNLETIPEPMVSMVRQKMTQIKPDITFLHGSADSSAFDFLAPVMMGFIIFFFIFILSGISFLRERMSGTLERMLVSPVNRLDVVMGYMLGFGFFAVIQTVLIQVFILYVLNIPTAGSFWEILLVNLALCLTALSLGGLCSTMARTEFQILQFIPIVIVPQMVFSGILDLREAPNWVHWLSNIFPLTYAGKALRQIMIRGGGILDVMPDFLVVVGFMVIFIVLNTLALKRKQQ